jgi:hypothetical protein
LQTVVNHNPGISVSYDPNPTAPARLQASDGLYPDKVLLTWDALCNGPAYTTFYRLSRATSQDGTKSPLCDWQTALQFDDKTAQPGTRYTYWVQAAISSLGLNAGDYSVPDVGWYVP